MRLGIRTRLALVVAALFAATATVGSLLVLAFVENRMVDNAMASARAVLDPYVNDLSFGTAVIVTDDDATTSATFFYLDADGAELTPREYRDAVMAATSAGLSLDGVGRASAAVVTRREAPEPGGTEGQLGEAGGGAIVGPTEAVGGVMTFLAERVGPVGPIDRGPGVTAVAQRIRLADGSELTVGAVATLEPVAASLAAVRDVLWVTVPLLALVAGGLTNLSVGRALAPVRRITRRTRAISETSLDERVPVPPAGDDIGELAVTMNRMLDRLEQAQRRQRRFLADASHELRSPVAASQAQLEVALTHPSAADWRDTAGEVLAEQRQLGDLIEGLLALSRLDERRLGPTTPTDVRALVRREAARHRANPVTVEPNGGDRPAMVDAVPADLVRAVRNLLDNADRHAAGAVAVAVAVDGSTVRVDVDDDGPGVAAADRELVFDRFTRLDEERTRGHVGAGLGLAITRQIVVAHGGAVRCAEAELGGARFTVELPVATEPPATVSPPAGR